MEMVTAIVRTLLEKAPGSIQNEGIRGGAISGVRRTRTGLKSPLRRRPV